MSGFTKGPWEAYFEHGIKADAYRIRSEKHKDWSICMGPNWFDEHSKENMANAHLIAASPDLYEALEALDNLSTDATRTDEYQEAWGKVDKALAKARGETP